MKKHDEIAEAPTALTADRDQIFVSKESAARDFKFDAKTAGVFDDMVDRSVPLYAEIQRMCCELAADFALDGTNLVDLGCATGTTLSLLDPIVTPGAQFIGIDNSPAMLEQARKKLVRGGIKRSYRLIEADIDRNAVIENASVVLMILTLQFVRPLYRELIMQRVYDGMLPNSALILVEKLTVKDGVLNRLFIEHYYEMKRRNGYSEIEIANKREALENVLIPYRWEENEELLKRSGFRHVEIFFRWYNFVGAIALK